MPPNPPSTSEGSSELGAPGFPSAASLRERDERLETLKELVAHLAHDFNNALAPVIGYITLLRSEIPEGTPGRAHFAKLGACVERADRLMDALLEATHPERQWSAQRVDLGDLLRRVSEEWLKTLPPTSGISLETSLVSCPMWLDETQWTNAIRQLLRNAQTALAGTGSVKLSLQNTTVAPMEAEALGLSDTNVVELVCEDNGCGMPEGTLRRAFEPLFTTRQGGIAAGLGLTLVHSVVRLHGGQIDLTSVEATGTRVRIWLTASA